MKLPSVLSSMMKLIKKYKQKRLTKSGKPFREFCFY